MKVYWRPADGTRTEITLGEVIGSGKEGDVYRFAGDGTLCVKVYREPRADVRRHIEVLMRIDAADWYVKEERHMEVAWPVDICEDEDGRATGFFMSTLSPRYFAARDAFSTARRARTPSLNWGCHVALAADLARMVGKLHAKDMLVGDLALPNLAVSSTGRVQFLDCDSFVITAGGRTYGGSTWRQDNSPPEGGPGKHTKATDFFAMAVAICEMLLEEFHPFAGVDTSVSSDDERSPAANIARGRSWLFHPDVRMPRGCPPPELLPGYLRDLAYAAFEKGARAPSVRPDARAWYQGLLKLGQSLRHCGRSPQHVFDAEEWAWCPWCERKDLLGGQDPFPSRHFAPAEPPWLQTLPTIGSMEPDDGDKTRNASVDRQGDACRADRDSGNDEERGERARKRAEHKRAWARIKMIHREDGEVTGTVTGVVKGGLIVDIGLRGFLPASLVDIGPVGDLQAYVGQEIKAKVVDMDANRNSVVLSRQAWLEQVQAEQRQTILSKLRPGQIVRGRVTRLKPFGAFVDLGGVDGLVRKSELSWTPVSHPKEVVGIGEELTVQILDVDVDRQHVTLSLKATQEDPWHRFARTHQIGQVVSGRVAGLEPFGAFVNLGDVDGMVHISELSWTSVSHPNEIVKIGQEITVQILDIDLDRNRVSLSLKQAALSALSAKLSGESVGRHRRAPV